MDALLRRKFENRFMDIEIVEREDLDLVRACSSLPQPLPCESVPPFESFLRIQFGSASSNTPDSDARSSHITLLKPHTTRAEYNDTSFALESSNRMERYPHL